MKLTDQIATRYRSLDYFALGAVLPNPDPILKAQGQDVRIYRDLRSDAHVGGCCRRRKSAVKALEWGFERESAGARLHNNLEAVFADIDLDRLIGDCIEAVFYGYAPIEAVWGRAGSLIVPAELRALPQEWFTFDVEGALRFRSKQSPWEGELLPERKFLLPRQDASYANPYGFPDLSMVFWPQVFKKGGMKFWLHFAEKFGTPWLIGKLPRGTPQGEMDGLADRLAAMVQDAIAVIPDDASIEPLAVSGTASADLYERLIMHCCREVSIALLGSNMGMENNSNRATAGAGLKVAEDLRDGDAEIVCSAVNQLVGWICDLNGWSGPRPVWRLWDQENKDSMQAQRDKTVTEAGAKLTAIYFQRAYGYAADEISEAAPPAPKPVIPANAGIQSPAFAEATTPTDPTDGATDLLASVAQPTLDRMIAVIGKMIDAAPDLASLQNTLLNAYGILDTERLTQLMTAAYALAELKGMSDLQDKSPATFPLSPRGRGPGRGG